MDSRRCNAVALQIFFTFMAVALLACNSGSSSSGDNPPPTTAKTISSLSLAPSSATLTSGQTQQYTASASYSDGSASTVTASATWTSSDASVATVSGSGLATAGASGTTTITATIGDVSSTASLTVTPSLTAITVAPPTTTLSVGQSQQLTATGSYSDGSTQDLTHSATWASTNTSVANVSASGLATALANGTATMQASAQGLTGSATLTVQAATANSLTLSPTTPVLQIGNSQQLSATLTYSDGSTQDVTRSASWASSQPVTVTVNSSGLITGVTSGASIITATYGGLSSYVAAPVPVQFASPKVTVFTNPSDSHLIAAQLADGSVITLFGSKDQSGFAIGISSATIAYANGTTATTQFDDLGRPILFQSGEGAVLMFDWLTSNAGTLEAISPDDKARIGPLALGGAGSSSPSVRYTQASHSLLARVRAAEVSAQESTPINNVVNVSVTRCSNRPVTNANVVLNVASSTGTLLWTPTAQPSPGTYAFSLPLPDSPTTIPLASTCDAVENTAEGICNTIDALAPLAPFIPLLDALLETTVFPPAALITIIEAAEELEEGMTIADFGELGSVTLCDLITTTLSAACPAAEAVDTASSGTLTLEASALVPGDNQPLTSSTVQVPVSNPGTTLTLTDENQASCAVQSVVVSPSTAGVSVGDTTPLTAAAYDGLFQVVPDTLTWAPEQGEFADVDQNGNVLGVAAGTQTVTATDGPSNISGTAQIAVAAAGVPHVLLTAPSPPNFNTTVTQTVDVFGCAVPSENGSSSSTFTAQSNFVVPLAYAYQFQPAPPVDLSNVLTTVNGVSEFQGSYDPPSSITPAAQNNGAQTTATYSLEVSGTIITEQLVTVVYFNGPQWGGPAGDLVQNYTYSATSVFDISSGQETYTVNDYDDEVQVPTSLDNYCQSHSVVTQTGTATANWYPAGSSNSTSNAAAADMLLKRTP
jgi:uncharacterized protein YjdB